MAMNFEDKVRCNNCMKEFFENEIIYNEAEDKEYCPYCGKSGCLMDLEEESFEVGDRVYAGDWCEGIIVDIRDDVAYVEFETAGGGGCLPFGLDTLEYIPTRVATLRTFRSSHGTVNVIIQNCSPEVTTLLWRFDVWKSNGRFEYDESKPRERAKIWFECPMDFLDFVESSMGRACFQRMGVEEFYIEH